MSTQLRFAIAGNTSGDSYSVGVLRFTRMEDGSIQGCFTLQSQSYTPGRRAFPWLPFCEDLAREVYGEPEAVKDLIIREVQPLPFKDTVKGLIGQIREWQFDEER